MPTEASTGPHSADDFADYFTVKVATIRASSTGALPPLIRPRLVPLLGCISNVTLEEVVKAIQKAPSKQCDLDPVPTWVVEKCGDILGPVITGMIKSSFSEGQFPESHKHALVRPRIKKSTLYPLDIKSF